MNEDKITPAINSQDELPTEMSPDEFQHRLYAWFEDRGLLSELRAHLRKQMIGVLKDKGVGRIVSASTISPKLQALNLLIAEFLLQQDYHYSLSVFSAEVPLTNVLPEFPSCGISNKNNNLKKWQFSDKDMWDILETLGIQRYTEEAQNIFNVYYNGTNNDSLLTCVVRMLHSLQGKSRNNDCNQVIKRDFGNWRKEAYNVLNSQNINTQNINKILRVLDDIIETEHARLRSESREDYIKLELELQSQYKALLKSQEERVSELQKTLDFQQSKNEEMAKDYQRQQSQHRDRLHKLIVREENVSQREAQMKEKDAFIKAQEYLIQSKLDALQKEQQSLMVFQEKLELEMHHNKLANKNDSKLRKDLESEREHLKLQVEDTKDDDEQAKMNILMAQLKNENDSLKVLNADQQLHIRDLSRRATLLVEELEDTQDAYHTLRSRERGIVTLPNLSAIQRGEGEAGEEGIRDNQRPHRQTSIYSNSRQANTRNVPRRLRVHSPSSSEEVIPTSELLKEARRRLRHLELESQELDRNYRLYQSTLTNNFQKYITSLKEPSTSFIKSFHAVNLYNLTIDKNIDEDIRESRELKQSEASSDVWDGAGTSGISFSAGPTSDEKSDSHQDDDDDVL